MVFLYGIIRPVPLKTCIGFDGLGLVYWVAVKELKLSY